MKLKNRFETKMSATPSMSDHKPMGKGKPNRHGMPLIPVGQIITKKWPVLDLGIQPSISLQDWSLRMDGAVENPLELNWTDFMVLPQTEDVSDFHCVTTWSRLDMNWKGVRFLDLAALVWLEDFLAGRGGALLVVSHDREFLDRTVTRIIEIDDHTRDTVLYAGNYSFYAEEKVRTRQRAYEGRRYRMGPRSVVILKHRLPQRPNPELEV